MWGTDLKRYPFEVSGWLESAKELLQGGVAPTVGRCVRMRVGDFKLVQAELNGQIVGILWNVEMTVIV